MRKQSRLKVGLFVTGSFLVLAGGLLWLAGSRFLRPVDTYEIVFDQSVSGLLPGSHVEYQGVTVGKVVKMRLTPEPPPRVVVTVELKPRTPVRQDTYATLIGSLVTNIRYIELRGGTPQSPPLEEGGTIQVKQEGIENITDRASQLSDQALQMVEQIKKNVLTKENIALIAAAVRNVGAIIGNLRATLDDVSTPQSRAAFRGLVLNVSAAAAGVRRTADILNGTKDDLAATMAELKQTVATAHKAATEVELLVRHMDFMVSQNQGEMNRLLSNMSAAAVQLRDAAGMIQQDPSSLLWGSHLRSRRIPDK